MNTPNLERCEKILSEVEETHTINPTLRDLAVWTGFSPSVIHYYLHLLAKHGLIEIERRDNRTPLKLTPKRLPSEG